MVADPDGIEARLRARPALGEVIGVAVALALVLVIFPDSDTAGTDWRVYYRAVDGVYLETVSEETGRVVAGATDTVQLGWYFPYWWLAPLEVFALLGETGGFVALDIVNIAGLVFACRVFGGRPAPVLLSFFGFRGLFLGSLTGTFIGLVAAFWWLAHRHRPLLAGVLAAFAGAKMQWGAPALLAGLLVSPQSWLDRSKAIAAGLAVAAGSFVVWGWWPAELVDRIGDVPPVGNLAPWTVVGPAMLVLWVPVLLLPMPSRQRLVAVGACAMLAAPYVQQHDFVFLLTMDGSWLGWVSWVLVVVDPSRTLLALVPVPLYAAAVVPAFADWPPRR